MHEKEVNIPPGYCIFLSLFRLQGRKKSQSRASWSVHGRTKTAYCRVFELQSEACRPPHECPSLIGLAGFFSITKQIVFVSCTLIPIVLWFEAPLLAGLLTYYFIFHDIMRFKVHTVVEVMLLLQ